MEKRLFWHEFCILWGAGVVIGAIYAAVVRLPTTPLARLLLLRNHAQKPLLMGVETIEITAVIQCVKNGKDGGLLGYPMLVDAGVIPQKVGKHHLAMKPQRPAELQARQRTGTDKDDCN